MIPLSVLDLAQISPNGTAQQALEETVRTAVAADEYGYLRFWVAEHHASLRSAGSSPAVLIAYIAARTNRIRVGSGGVMLTNYAPFVVAEQFAVIHALNEGRVDLGVGRASGGVKADAPLDRALGRTAKSRSLFPALVDELTGFLHHEWPEGNDTYRDLELSPAVPAPDLFVLGATENGAEVAAERGLSFVFGRHLSAQKYQQTALEHYRATFTSNGRGTKPYTIASVNVVCADDDQTAEQAAREAAGVAVRRNHTDLYPDRSLTAIRESYLVDLSLEDAQVVHGSPDSVREQLDHLAAELNVDELMLVPWEVGGEARRRTLRLIARV